MLFQEKLLPVCVCTETLAAGINLPARLVILTTLVKGPRDKKRLIEPGSAQQMFGRADRNSIPKGTSSRWLTKMMSNSRGGRKSMIQSPKKPKTPD